MISERRKKLRREKRRLRKSRHSFGGAVVNLETPVADIHQKDSPVF